jgi:hypothetical protein
LVICSLLIRGSVAGWGTILLLFIYLNCKGGFTRWQWYYNKTQHTNNTHHTQTKHSTQNYTDNKGHTTHNEYNYNYSKNNYNYN